MDPFAYRHFWIRKINQTCKSSLLIERGSIFKCLLVKLKSTINMYIDKFRRISGTLKPKTYSMKFFEI